MSMYKLKSDVNSNFTLSALIVYENVFPRYVKVSLSLTGGITSLFNLRFGLNCVDELPFFLIPKVEHLSTHIIKPVQLHHLLNTFKRNWLSFQLILWYPNHQQIETSDVVIKSWQNYNPYNEFFHGQLIL